MDLKSPSRPPQSGEEEGRCMQRKNLFFNLNSFRLNISVITK